MSDTVDHAITDGFGRNIDIDLYWQNTGLSQAAISRIKQHKREHGSNSKLHAVNQQLFKGGERMKEIIVTKPDDCPFTGEDTSCCYWTGEFCDTLKNFPLDCPLFENDYLIKRRSENV